MILDIVLLSGLLFVSGGSANPFAIFFLVNLTLGAIVLRATWAWVLRVFTLACFTALFQFHQDLAGLSAVRLGSVREVFSGKTAEPFERYMPGKLVAVATVSAILVYFITRLTTELRQQQGVIDFECGVHDDRLEIIVRDRGAGMTADVLARVGEPFFTTKEPGQGIGLGLFISRAVVEQLGGTLRIHSARGSGTTAVIAVPALDIL